MSFLFFLLFLFPFFHHHVPRQVDLKEHCANRNAHHSAGGAVTAMGVTADLIKVIQRVS